MRNPGDFKVPSDPQLERELLGCMCRQSPAALREFRAVAGEHALFFEEHRRIFRSLCRLDDAGLSLTYSAVYQDMQARSEPISLGYLIDLGDVAIDYGFEANVRRARELAFRREAVLRGTAFAQRAGDLTVSVRDLEADAQAIREAFAGVEPAATAEDIGQIIEQAGGIQAFMAPKHGIPSPWPELDYCTGGWQKGELTILAARPSMGKTALALNLLLHAAISGVPGDFYSLEMDQQAIIKRLISLRTGISFRELVRGELNASERRAVTEAMELLRRIPLRIIAAAGRTAMAIVAHAERLHRKGQLEISAVDYIGLIARSPGSGSNRNQEIGEICLQFKIAASELHVPIVLLSQLSRATENRTDKRPVMSDLRDSGELENHGDLICFIHRPEYFSRNDPELRGVAELIIAKQRNGACPTVPLVFHHESGRFESEGGRRAESIDHQMGLGV